MAAKKYVYVIRITSRARRTPINNISPTSPGAAIAKNSRPFRKINDWRKNMHAVLKDIRSMLINVTELLSSNEAELAVQLIKQIDKFEKQEKIRLLEAFKQNHK